MQFLSMKGRSPTQGVSIYKFLYGRNEKSMFIRTVGALEVLNIVKNSKNKYQQISMMLICQ